MKTRLHVRAEYGELRIQAPYDLDHVADLAVAWRAASAPSAPLTALFEAEEALREYLRLDLDLPAALALAVEMDAAGVRADPF